MAPDKTKLSPAQRKCRILNNFLDPQAANAKPDQPFAVMPASPGRLLIVQSEFQWLR
jgi:hypothetical protein